MIQSSVKIIIIIFLIQGCFFYSMRGSLPAHINSISLAPVVNESSEFAAAEILNDELNELMVSENVLDIVMIVDLILNNPNPSEMEILLGDLTNDGLVNVLDIVALVDTILNP